MNYLKSIFLCFVFITPTLSNAQSKTEKVEDKLSGGGSGGGSSSITTGGTSSNSDVEDSLFGIVFEIFFSGTFSNISTLFYLQKLTPDEYSMHYNPYPYFQDGYTTGNGLRNSYAYKSFALNVDLDVSKYPFTLVDENYGASAKLSYDYWALDTSFRLWDETGSPKYMRQFSVALERKMRFFPQSEAGLQFGYQQLKIGTSSFKGGIIGFDSEYYWLKPVSAHFNIHALIFENAYATLMQTGLRYHFNHSAILLNYQSLDFGGIVFKGFNVGYSIYF